jgi:hypothetical protein
VDYKLQSVTSLTPGTIFDLSREGVLRVLKEVVGGRTQAVNLMKKQKPNKPKPSKATPP